MLGRSREGNGIRNTKKMKGKIKGFKTKSREEISQGQKRTEDRRKSEGKNKLRNWVNKETAGVNFICFFLYLFIYIFNHVFISRAFNDAVNGSDCYVLRAD
jgi:magnesium-transporting ATPase (P-type)